MGLDMYLKARGYFSPAEFRGEDNNTKFEKLIEVAEVSGYLDDGLPHAYLEVAVGYWRKSNQIHKWFVDHAQNGVDECQESYVSRDQLKELLESCEQVIEAPALAPEILPVSEGFFFGSQDYDEDYFGDLEETVKILEKVLKMPEDWDFYYQSSW